MMDKDLTLLFEGNEVFVYRNGVVVASGPADEVDEVAARAEEEDDGEHESTEEQASREASDAEESGVDEASREEDDEEEVVKESGVYVKTPNGISGRVLGKAAGLYGDEVSIRLANGNVITVGVTPDMSFIQKEARGDTTISDLQRLSNVIPDPGFDSLSQRLEEVSIARQTAIDKLRTAKYDDRSKLHRIILAFEAETDEINEVLDRYAAEQSSLFENDAPYSVHVGHQPDLGHASDSQWLANVDEEMTREAAEFDFDKFLNEGSATFVAELDDAVVADAGSTRYAAKGFVESKLSRFTSDVAKKYKQAFVDKVEQNRKKELSKRKGATKEASSSDLPDEALFNV